MSSLHPSSTRILSSAPPFFTAENLSLPGIRHGFFGRQGGVSDGLFSSLNVGYGSGDDIEKITENRARITAALKASALCTAFQIHSTHVVTVEKAWSWKDAPEADALVTQTPGIALGILTADCVPVLFADPQAKVIGAAHAGWKGVIGHILEATIVSMESLGAKRGAIHAAIGPAIGQDSYEIGPEYFERFEQKSLQYERFFTAPHAKGRRYFAIAEAARAQLEESRLASINLLAKDTCLEEDACFSFRRATLRGQKQYGRQMSALVIGDESLE